MSLTLPRCFECEEADEGMVTVAVHDSGSGPGFAWYACRDCLIEQRLVPLVHHPDGSWGGAMPYPPAVPDDIVVKLADLGESGELRPITTRLFTAVRREDKEAAAAAVEELRAAGRRDLHAVPGPGVTS